MSFPLFDAGRKKVLFFSRGRGRGHAIADIQIAEELGALREDVQIRFVSYGTGARTFAERGIAVIDLALPDANGIAATMVLVGRAIGRLQPDLVIAHEEFSALPAAKIFGIRTLFITDFFSDSGTFATESLWFADHVLFLDRKGVFAEPAPVRGRVRYVGPVLRQFAYSRRDRLRAREELGIARDATVIGVFPGSWTEAVAPLVERMVEAFDGARLGEKHLIWLAGRDVDVVRGAVGDRRDATVLETEWRVDRLMVACDLAITKANRMTVRELAALGIRTVSVSYGLNAPDEQAIAPLRSNRTIGVEDLTGRMLKSAVRLPEPRPAGSRRGSCAAEIARILGS
jgi:predicted glycosyltransferase